MCFIIIELDLLGDSALGPRTCFILIITSASYGVRTTEYLYRIIFGNYCVSTSIGYNSQLSIETNNEHLASIASSSIQAHVLPRASTASRSGPIPIFYLYFILISRRLLPYEVTLTSCDQSPWPGCCGNPWTPTSITIQPDKPLHTSMDTQCISCFIRNGPHGVGKNIRPNPRSTLPRMDVCA